MAGWSDGYVTEIQYTGQFYPELAPGYLAFCCLRQSIRPPALGTGATYLELGCGQGFGLNLLAAANPGMQFVGVDFNPAQIANAARLAAEAGLSNVTFADDSFAQMLAAPDGRWPKCDVIALHGVYSWVSVENRAMIVQIIDRLLKPGGLVYVSYNCLPGWSANAALQRFIQDHVAQGAGDLTTRIVTALKAAQEIQEGGALYFKGAPSLKARIAQALNRPPEYLAHEYLNLGSEPLFSADVAGQMAGARLTLAASAGLADDIVHLSAPAPLQPMIQGASDRTWRETLLDYASNRVFRRDVFVRGVNPLTREERDALLDATPFALLVPAGDVGLDSTVPIGTLSGNPQVYRPVLDALADGPKTFRELLRLAQAREDVVLQALTLLTGRRQIHPCVPDRAGASAASFNRALLDRMAFGEIPSQLAAGGVGTGVDLKLEEVLAVSAHMAGEEAPRAMAHRGWDILARTGRRLRKDGAVLEDQTANEAELAQRIAEFTASRLPLLRDLGVLGT
ncbi:class I SAM-dependent methyltransferase [Phenylobacterium sp.]|uniref:class I SAM-dependent methyltransferase n=1 Tax=Phenylobacterium sp. TaxID=1871053 RepID=UPI0025D703C0|nr:class I SAM-dependent methyltransferase [Phenylobacterium sp.]